MMRSLLVLYLLFVGCGPSQMPSFTGVNAGLTWHRDVRPIVTAHCGGCHAPGGVGGLVLDGSPELTDLMLTKLHDGTMPPWPPGPLGPPLVGARQLQAGELQIIEAWAAKGSPAGDSAYYHAPPVVTRSLPSITLSMPAPFHSTRGQSDQYRCFVLPGLSGGWITSLVWALGNPAAAHHVGGVTVDAAGLALLHSRSLDSPVGFDCPSDFGPAPTIAGLSSTGTGDSPGFDLPASAGIAAPVGGAIVMQIHYLPDAVPSAGDVSGVSLWIDIAPRREVREFQFTAPVELPCALGISSDPSNRCSREWAFERDPFRSPVQARSDADLSLARCGQTLDGYYARLPWQTEPAPSFLVSTSCVSAFPVDGDLLGVHLHAHTRATSGRIEVQQPDGSWLIVLDIPRWRWTWEAAYQLVTPVRVHAGQPVRVSCVIDNGTAAQWGPAGPGRDGPAVPPLESESYHVGGAARDSEMCAAFLQIESLP